MKRWKKRKRNGRKRNKNIEGEEERDRRGEQVISR